MRYKIVKTVYMGFILDDDQVDVFLDPRRGIILEREIDGETIYVNWPNGDRRMSITQAHAIETWLGDGLIEPLADCGYE